MLSFVIVTAKNYVFLNNLSKMMDRKNSFYSKTPYFPEKHLKKITLSHSVEIKMNYIYIVLSQPLKAIYNSFTHCCKQAAISCNWPPPVGKMSQPRTQGRWSWGLSRQYSDWKTKSQPPYPRSPCNSSTFSGISLALIKAHNDTEEQLISVIHG